MCSARNNRPEPCCRSSGRYGPVASCQTQNGSQHIGGTPREFRASLVPHTHMRGVPAGDGKPKVMRASPVASAFWKGQQFPFSVIRKPAMPRRAEQVPVRVNIR